MIDNTDENPAQKIRADLEAFLGGKNHFEGQLDRSVPWVQSNEDSRIFINRRTDGKIDVKLAYTPSDGKTGAYYPRIDIDTTFDEQGNKIATRGKEIDSGRGFTEREFNGYFVPGEFSQIIAAIRPL